MSYPMKPQVPIRSLIPWIVFAVIVDAILALAIYGLVELVT